jgi:hypothetical protein
VSLFLVHPYVAALLNKAVALHSGVALAYDTFDRADGALGTSDSGHVWSVLGGTAAIASNAIDWSADDAGAHGQFANTAIMPNVAADVFAEGSHVGVGTDFVKVRVAAKDEWVGAYYFSTADLYLATHSNAGGLSALGFGTMPGGALAAGEKVAIRAVGSSLRVYGRGLLVFSASSAVHATEDDVGAGAAASAGGFRDLYYYEP